MALKLLVFMAATSRSGWDAGRPGAELKYAKISSRLLLRTQANERLTQPLPRLPGALQIEYQLKRPCDDANFSDIIRMILWDALPSPYGKTGRARCAYTSVSSSSKTASR